MVMYDNEFGTKENKIQTKDKIEPQHKHAEGKIFRSGITAISNPFINLSLLSSQCFSFLGIFLGIFLGFIFRNKIFSQWPQR